MLSFLPHIPYRIKSPLYNLGSPYVLYCYYVRIRIGVEYQMKRNNRNKCTQRKQFALTWHGTISSVITETIMDGDRKISVINFPLLLAEWKINYYRIHNTTGQYVTHSICVKNTFTSRRSSTYAMPKQARARAGTHAHTHTHTHAHTHALLYS